jgi:hypothetical protein
MQRTTCITCAGITNVVRRVIPRQVDAVARLYLGLCIIVFMEPSMRCTFPFQMKPDVRQYSRQQSQDTEYLLIPTNPYFVLIICDLS